MNGRKIRLIYVLSGCIILIKREGKKCFSSEWFASPNVSDTFKTAPCGFMDRLRTWICCRDGGTTVSSGNNLAIATYGTIVDASLSIGWIGKCEILLVICGPCGFLMFGNPVRCCPGKTRSVMPMRDRLWTYAAQPSCGKQTQRRWGQQVSLVISFSSTQSLSSSSRHWPRFHRHLVTKLCSCT